MTRLEFQHYLDELTAKEQRVREIAQKEYAHDEGNAFANFERIAERLGMTREEVLLVYFFKHIDGIIAYVTGVKAQRESIQGRILDARLYLALLGGMFEEHETVEAA